MNDIEIKNIYSCGRFLNVVALISAGFFYYFNLFSDSLMLIAIFVLGIIGFLNLSVYKSIMREEKISLYSNMMVAITMVAVSGYVLCIFFTLGRIAVSRLGF